jgi:hypothetical protein
VLISNGKKERKVKPGTHARDRGYFKFQKSNTADTAYISAARKGRNTGIVTVRLVRRITDADGKFQGIIMALIKTEQLLNFFETTRIGPNSSATLVGLDKRIRVRKSQKGLDGVGKKIERSKLWASFSESENGSYVQASILDNISRVWTYRKIKDYPVIAVIGTAVPDAIA